MGNFSNFILDDAVRPYLDKIGWNCLANQPLTPMMTVWVPKWLWAPLFPPDFVQVNRGVCSHADGCAEKPEECVLSDQSPLSSGVDSGQQSPVSPENRKTQRGIKKLWGKWVQPVSAPVSARLCHPSLCQLIGFFFFAQDYTQPVRQPGSGPWPGTGRFQKRRIPIHSRSQTGPASKHPVTLPAPIPRMLAPTLGLLCLWSVVSSCVDSSHLVRNMKLPFAKWSAEQVCEWLEEIGLGQYVTIARHWVTGGQTLLSATPQDLERVCLQNGSFDASGRLINTPPSTHTHTHKHTPPPTWSVSPVRSMLLSSLSVCRLVMPASGFQPAGWFCCQRCHVAHLLCRFCCG